MTVDTDADAAYVRLREGKVASTASPSESVNVDLDINGQPLGVELLNISHGIILEGVPAAERVRLELRAAGLDDGPILGH